MTTMKWIISSSYKTNFFKKHYFLTLRFEYSILSGSSNLFTTSITFMNCSAVSHFIILSSPSSEMIKKDLVHTSIIVRFTKSSINYTSYKEIILYIEGFVKLLKFALTFNSANKTIIWIFLLFYFFIFIFIWPYHSFCSCFYIFNFNSIFKHSSIRTSIPICS